jgi:hypothetical protein
MFNSPVRTGHHYLMSAHNRMSQSTGFLGIEGFRWAALKHHLTDEYMGLIPYMPWLALFGPVGAVALAATGEGRLPRGLGWAFLAMVAFYLYFVGSLGKFKVMNGWSVGPRYLLPVVLPMALVAAVGWQWMERRVPVLARGAAGLVLASIVVIAVVTAAFPSPPNNMKNPFADFALPLLQEGWSVRHLGLTVGAGLWPLWALLGAAGLAILAMPMGAGIGWQKRAAGAGLGALLAWGGVAWAMDNQLTPTTEAEDARRWATTVVEGQSPHEERTFFPPRP